VVGVVQTKIKIWYFTQTRVGIVKGLRKL